VIVAAVPDVAVPNADVPGFADPDSEFLRLAFLTLLLGALLTLLILPNLLLASLFGTLLRLIVILLLGWLSDLAIFSALSSILSLFTLRLIFLRALLATTTTTLGTRDARCSYERGGENRGGRELSIKTSPADFSWEAPPSPVKTSISSTAIVALLTALQASLCSPKKSRHLFFTSCERMPPPKPPLTAVI